MSYLGDVKAAELAVSKEEKIANLTNKKISLNYEPDTLVGMNDADSLVTQNLGDTRSVPTIGRYDAVEVKHGNHPYNMYGISREERDAGNIGKSPYAMEQQRLEVSNILNKPLNTITEQDMIDVGNMQQIQKLADLTRSKGEPRWKAPLIHNVEQTNLTGHYIDKNSKTVDAPLDIPINVKTQGIIGNRYGASVQNPSTGINVTNEATKDPLLNAFANQQKENQDLSSTEFNPLTNSEAINHKFIAHGPRWENPIKGAGSTVLGAAYGTTDAISELTGYLTNGTIGGSIATPEEITKFANEATGYDPSYMNNAGKKIKSAYRKFQKDKDWGNFLENAGTAGLSVAGEAGATSLALVATLFLPGKPLQAASKLGKLIKAETAGMNAVDKAAKTKELISNAKTVDKLVRIGQGQTGFVAASMADTSSDMDAYKAKYDESMSPTRAMSSFGINLIANNLDGFIDKHVITQEGIGSNTVRKLIHSADDSSKVKLAKNLIARGFGVAGDTILKEVPTEVIQSEMQHVSQEYNPDKTNISDILTSQNAQEDMAVSAMMTPGAVGAMKGVGVAGEATGKVAKSTKNKLDDIVLENAKQNAPKKPTEEQTKTKEKLDILQKVAETGNTKIMPTVLEKLDSIDTSDRKVRKQSDYIRKMIADKLATQKLTNVDDLNLGSEEEATAFMEEVYSTTDNKESPTLLDNMVRLGKKFNVPKEKVKTIKDSATVETEITTGARGYKTYNSSLIRLKKNPKQNSEAIKRLEAQILHFKATQEDRLDRMNKAISEIEANLKSGIQTEHKVSVPYASGGKWTIHIKDGKIGESTYQRVKDLQRTVKGIQDVIEKRNIEVPTSEYRIPDKVTKETRKGVFRNITNAIKSRDTVTMPIISKRMYKGKMKQHFTYAMKQLKAHDYVEVNANNEVTNGYGRWVPKAQSKPNKAKETEKTIKEEKKEVNRLGKKQAKGIKLEPKEKAFVDTHKAEVAQASEEYNVIAKLNDIDNKLASAKEKLTILDENNVDDVDEIVSVNDDIGRLKEEREALLNKDVIKELLKTSSSTKVTEPKKGIAGAKFKQPVNVNEYVQEKPSTSLLGSVHVRFFDNKVIQEARSKVPKILKTILAPVDYKNNPKLKNAKVQKEMLNAVSSPARGLIFTTDGEVNENVAVAIDAALTEYMAMGASNLGTKTSEEVARLIGNSSMSPNAKQMEFFKDLGNYRKNTANDIGKAVLANLGLKENNNIPRELYAKLVADLGNMAIELGIEEGMLYNTDVNLKTHNEIIGKSNPNVSSQTTVPFIRFSNKGKEALELHKVNFDRYKEALHIEDTFYKGPHSKAVKTKDISIRNNPITEQPEEGTEVLNTLRKEKYVKQDAVVSWLTDKVNEEVVKYHMGYKSEEDMAKMSFYSKESQKAKNEEIERSIEFLRNEKLDEMYFNWFYSRNGRYMMDSNTLNPQTDKLHRFAVVPASHKVTINKDNEEEMRVFRTAIAQAFNLSTDKVPTEEVQAYGEKLLNTDPDVLMKELTDMDEKAEHIAHYIQGVEAVKAYQKGEKDFTTYLSMESDAVTSGFGLKLLQLPILGKKGESGSDIDTVKDWMRKTGIFVNEIVTSMNDMVSKDGFTDSYETLAKEVSPDEVKESNYPEKETKTGKKWSPWTNVIKYDKELNHSRFVKVLPKPNDDGTVSKELRTLFKSPFMTFNYSSGINTIKNRLGTIIADGLIDTFVSGKMSKDEALLLADLKGIYGKDLVNKLINKDPSTINSNPNSSLPNIYKYLIDMSINTYGHLSAKSLEENFKAFNESNEVINKAFEEMFLEYNKAYLIEVEKIEDSKGRGITEKENIELIRSLRNKFPLIKGPYSVKKDFSDTIAIYDTDNVSSKRLEETYGTVSTKMANGVSKKVQSKLKEIKASLKGGSVIPIHYIDAAVIGNTLKSSKGILGIHDAIIPNILNTITNVKEYNKNVIEVNKGYSVIKEVIDSYKRIVGKDGTEEQKEILQNLEAIQKEAQINRDIIFNSNIDVVHMSAVPGSKYAHKPNVQSKYSKAQIEAIKGIILDKNNKPRLAFRKLIKDLNLDMKDC